MELPVLVWFKICQSKLTDNMWNQKSTEAYNFQLYLLVFTTGRLQIDQLTRILNKNSQLLKSQQPHYTTPKKSNIKRNSKPQIKAELQLIRHTPRSCWEVEIVGHVANSEAVKYVTAVGKRTVSRRLRRKVVIVNLPHQFQSVSTCNDDPRVSPTG